MTNMTIQFYQRFKNLINHSKYAIFRNYCNTVFIFLYPCKYLLVEAVAAEFLIIECGLCIFPISASDPR